MSRRVVATAHQPEYLPPPRFFHKVAHADVLIFLDGPGIMFDRSSYQHRARIAKAGKAMESRWLTIPFAHVGSLQELRSLIASGDDWAEEHLRHLRESYRDAPHWAEMGPRFELALRHWRAVAGGSIPLISQLSVVAILAWLGLSMPRIVDHSSTLVDCLDPTDRLIALCKHVGATVYLSGRSGAKILREDAFERSGIELRVQNYDGLNTGGNWSGLSILHSLCVAGVEAVREDMTS